MFTTQRMWLCPVHYYSDHHRSREKDCVLLVITVFSQGPIHRLCISKCLSSVSCVQLWKQSFKQTAQIQIRTQIRCTIWPGWWYPWFICFRVTGHTFRCNKPVVNTGDFYSESVSDAQEYITLAGTLLEASSVQCDSTLRHMIQIERVHREGSDTAIPSIKPRAFNWNVPWKAPRVSDEGMRWLRSPQYGLSQHYFSCMKHLMARKLAGRLNLPLDLFCDAEERYLALPGFDQSSCCAGIVYFITLIFLFLYASLSEDSYLSWALLRGKAQQSTNSEMGNDLLPLALLYFFLAGAEHRKNSPLRCCNARFRTPQDPKAIPLVELFWYSIHAWSESRQPHLMISIDLTVTYTIFV